MTFESSRARRRLLAVLVLIAVFVAGSSAGMAWGRVRRDQVNVNVRMSTDIPADLRELSLTSTQEDSLRRVLADGQRRVRAVLRDFEPRLKGALDSVDAAIGAVLTPEQRARFEAGNVRRRRSEIQIDTVRR